MKIPKLAIALGIAVLSTWPLAAEKWAQLEDGKGYTSGGETILARVTPQPASRVVDTARSFEGTPYVWAGSSPTKGFDCSGFVHEVMRLNGYAVPRMADHQFYKSIRVSRADLQPGDMVFFETYLPGPSHVGFFLGENKFIHASSSGRGVTVSNLNSSYYADRFLGGGRPPGWLEEGPKASYRSQPSVAKPAPKAPPVMSKPVQPKIGRPVVASRPFEHPPLPRLVELPSPSHSRTRLVDPPAASDRRPVPRPTAVPR